MLGTQHWRGRGEAGSIGLAVHSSPGGSPSESLSKEVDTHKVDR